MTYTKDDFRQMFQKPFNIDEWQQILQHYFHATELRLEPERTKESTDDEQGYYLGAIDTTDCYRIGLFYYKIQHGNIARKRVGLRNLVKSFVNPLLGDFNAALVVFDSGTLWRLSLICDMKGESTAPKRFTYVFGESDNYYNTPVGRFKALQDKGISYANLRDAFSVEQVNKTFFAEYKAQYEKFCQYLCENLEMQQSFQQFSENSGKAIRDYVKKMLGRIVFLYFVQRKGWLNGDLLYMSRLFSQSADDVKADFLDRVLEPMFFGLLNTPQEERHANAQACGWDLSLIPGWENIPYLNGGLFEQDSIDKCKSVFPCDYFKGLFDFFDSYNFTVDENDPNDAEVGIDPEMLGVIFENLLEDNKDKGAFYTPKEIVRYMCQESLIAYLNTNTDISQEQLRQFVISPEDNAEDFSADYKDKLLSALQAVKICDPAIGSGAFPMGLLNELLHCREALGESADHAQIKKSIIQNNIYGVDIEKGAVDIARLRFWLSLVVDEDVPQPLPNLDYKIMQGNSLLESFMGYDLSRILPVNKNGKTSKFATKIASDNDRQGRIVFDDEQDSIAEIQRLIRLYFSPQNHKQKEILKRNIDTKVKEYIMICGGNTPSIVEAVEEIDDNNKPFFLWHLFFADVFQEGGFDIVIGNPPYIQLQGNGGALADLYAPCDYKTFTRTGDIYSLFYERGWQMLKPNGNLCYITSNKWMRAGYGESTRDFFAKYTNPEILIDFSGVETFGTATVVTNILLFTRSSNKGNTICVATTNQHKDCLTYLHEYVRDNKYIQNLSTADGWIMLTPSELELKRKIIKVGKPLKDWNIKICRGVLTGYNEAFIISTEKRNEILSNCQSKDERTKTEELIHPILRGRDIKRFGYDWANLWLINTHNGTMNRPCIDINEYPAIKNHLDKHWVKISKRTDKGNTPYNLRNCAYLDDFKKPKVIYPETTKGARFAFDNTGIYIDKTCFMLISDAALYLQKTLSSKLFEVAYNKMFSSVELVNHTYQYNKHALLKLPIMDDADAIKQLSVIEDEQDIDIFIYRLYGLTYDEILIIDPETPITKEEYEK